MKIFKLKNPKKTLILTFNLKQRREVEMTAAEV